MKKRIRIKNVEFWRLVSIGFILVLTGAVLPFLMVMRIIEPTFLLSFVSHGASVTGLFLGIIGAAQYISEQRNTRDNPRR